MNLGMGSNWMGECTPLIKAAEDGYRECVQPLIAIRDFGWTAMLKAADCGHADIVELLLSHGVSSGSSWLIFGQDAATLARGRGRWGVLEVLERHNRRR